MLLGAVSKSLAAEPMLAPAVVSSRELEQRLRPVFESDDTGGQVEDAVEISEAEIDDQIIDEGLAMVRRLWNNGLAHRDIKPANLLVKDGHLVVIDVAFATATTTPGARLPSRGPGQGTG